MPYYRRKRGYYKKRRFTRKPLKKSNIFSKKSARSQAKQIYALNKKVNKIQRLTKPELYIYENGESNVVTGHYQPYNQTTYQGCNLQYGILNEIMKNETMPFKISGGMARIQSLKLTISFVRTAAAVNHLDTIGRLTILKQKKSVGGSVRIHNTNSYLIQTLNPVVYGPLKSDCTEWGQIIYDRTFKMKKDVGGMDKIIRLNLKPFTLRLREDNEGGLISYDPDCEFIICITMGHIGIQTAGDDIYFRCGVKIAYIDDNFDNSSSKTRTIKDLNPALDEDTENKIKSRLMSKGPDEFEN